MKALPLALCVALLLAFAGCSGSGPSELPTLAEVGPEVIAEQPEVEEAHEETALPARATEVPLPPAVPVDENTPLAAVLKGGKWGFIDQTGAYAIQPQYEQVLPFSEGLAAVKMPRGGWIFIDKQNKPVVEVRADLWVTSGLHEGMAAVTTNGNQGFDNPCGFIDQAGMVVVEPQYTRVWDFGEGLAAVETVKDTSGGYIDKTGTMIIEPAFSSFPVMQSFSEGLAAVQLPDGTSGYIDKSGTLVIARQKDAQGELIGTFRAARGDFHDGLAPANYDSSRDGGLCLGFIDKTGKAAFPGCFSSVNNYSEGLAAVQASSEPFGTGFVDTQGNVVIAFQDKWKVEGAWGFHEGMARVYSDGRTGYVDTTGALVIATQYYQGSDFSEGLAAVENGDGFGYVDKTGATAIEHQFQSALPFTK